MNLINIMSVYKVTCRRFHTGESINIYELLETYKIIPALLGDTYTRGKVILKCVKMTYNSSEWILLKGRGLSEEISDVIDNV